MKEIIQYKTESDNVVSIVEVIISNAAVMESISENRILKFKPDTLDFLRNQYGFDTTQRMNEAIDSLQEWAAKQEHFMMKSFGKLKVSCSNSKQYLI